VSDYVKLLAQKAELEKKRIELDKALKEERRTSQSAVIAQVLGLMKEHGLSVADLRAGVLGGPGKGRGGTVPPKYRNSATGETWSGRGLKPKWVQAALDAGKTLEDLRV
jgi:DNA-binding protein H-NS